MAVLGRDEILTAKDTKTEKVPVPEWGGEVYLRVISGMERDKLEMSLQGNNGKKNVENFRARFAVLVLCDEEGKKLFSLADIPQLSEKSATALERVLDAGLKLNKFSEKDVEELAENLEEGQS